MRSAAGSLPAGDLDAVLRSRLEQAGPPAREVAALAAAVGRDVPLDLLVAAGELDVDGVVAAVDELWRLRILRERGQGYDFSHDLLRDAAYATITPARRWLLHRRVAQGLEELHADDLGPVAAQLAEQYARGGRPERAVAYYRRAAEVATCVFAHAEAVRLHTAALEIVRSRPPGRDRDADELAVLEAMAAPLNARHGYASVELQAVLERSVALAESLGRRTSLVDVSGRAVRVAVRPGTGRRGARGRVAGARPRRAGHRGQRGRALRARRSRPRASAGPPRRCDHLAVATDLGRGDAAQRRHPHRRARRGRGHRTRTGSAATTPRRRPACGRRSRSRGRWTTPTASRCPSATPPSCGRCATTGRSCAAPSAELRELCARYGFGYYREWGTGARRVVPRRRGGRRAGPRGDREARRRRRARPHALLAGPAGRPARPDRRPRRGPDGPRHRRGGRAQARRRVVAPRGAADAGRVRRRRRRGGPAAGGRPAGRRPRQRSLAAPLRARSDACPADPRRAGIDRWDDRRARRRGRSPVVLRVGAAERHPNAARTPRS